LGKLFAEFDSSSIHDGFTGVSHSNVQTREHCTFESPPGLQIATGHGPAQPV
jgi:hypothetical protein